MLIGSLVLAVVGVMVIMMFAFSLFSTAMFAEPAAAEIEEVSRLVHGSWGTLCLDLCTRRFVPLPNKTARCKTQSLSALSRRAECA